MIPLCSGSITLYPPHISVELKKDWLQMAASVCD